MKLDGTYLGAGMLGAAVLVRALLVRSRGGSPWRTVGLGGMALAAFGVLLLPWQVYIHLHHLGSSIPATDTVSLPQGILLWEGIRVIGAELLLSYKFDFIHFRPHRRPFLTGAQTGSEEFR